MGTQLRPLAGYPFALDIRVAYELGGDGLVVSTTAANIGDRACPYGTGQHPCLSPGRGQINDCMLELAASTRILTANERQLPTGRGARGGDRLRLSMWQAGRRAETRHPLHRSGP
jgi:aldose 1-epimerase